jgi:hydroxymethylpyrimidine pyrophosphatase-like HAD family hydrolase
MALRDASERGVTLVLATGRLSSGALPTARDLHVETPLVCADGSVIACAHDGATLEVAGIDPRAASLALGELARQRLARFVFHSDAIRCEDAGRALLPFLRGWTERATVSPKLEGSLDCSQRPAVILLGVGERNRVEIARDHVARAEGASLRVDAFNLGDERAWAVRAQRTGVSKASALARVAAYLDCDLGVAAAVGDWYNDVPMLECVGRSFAMGHAPGVVRRTATDVLRATADSGGGIAEAIARWLPSVR